MPHYLRAIFVSLFIAAIACNMFGQPGTLDPTFGNSGIVTTDFGGNFDQAHAMVVQADGKILLAGKSTSDSTTEVSLALARYDSMGILDNSFGIGGIVTTSFGDSSIYGNGIVVQPDGKIIVAGGIDYGWAVDVALVRYHSDGSIDSTFGTDGLVTTAVSSFNDAGVAMVGQPDGKFLVAVNTSVSGHWEFALVRYNVNGTLDASFGNNGKVVTDIGASDDVVHSITLLPDGRILLAGGSNDGANTDIAVVRYNTDGSLDSSFDEDGKVTTGVTGGYIYGSDVVAQPDGRIVVAALTGFGPMSDFVVVRYQMDGALDDSFGSGGFVVTALGPAADASTSVALQPDGKILLAGWSYDSTNELAVVRYNGDGALDDTFSGDGIVLTPVEVGVNGPCMTLREDNRILVGGDTWNGSERDFLLVCYQNDLNVGVVGFDAKLGEAFVYPNPLGDETALEYELATAEELTCILLDAQGRVIRMFYSNAHRGIGPHRETLDLSGIVAGNYTVVLSDGTGKVSVRVVKQ
jgi:uncharacterized delta-60 repeat protein